MVETMTGAERLMAAYARPRGSTVRRFGYARVFA